MTVGKNVGVVGGIEIQVLGPFRLLVEGRPAELPGDRRRTLLALLAMAPGELVSVETIGERVWNHEPPVHMRRSVHRLVARLRQVLGPAAIATSPGGYVLTVDPHQVDAWRFVHLLGEAAGASDPGEERAMLSRALSLWRGEPFDGINAGRLAEPESTQLTERYLAAIERRVDLDVVDGRVDDLTDELRRLAARYPLRESLWRRLITVLALSGRQAEALETYEAVRTRIADELGADPGAELQRIHLKLLSGGTTRAAGDDHLDPTPSVPRQLPSDVEGFAGRTGALKRLDGLLDDGPGAGSRPVVMMAVHGAGGVGKTTLAVHWAHRVKGRYPDGQLYVNLRGYGPGDPMDPAAALDIMLRGLGVNGDQIPATVEGRSALLRTTLASRRVLVILDNARDPEQTRPLLPGEGSSLVIVTSRSQLRGLAARDGARRVSLDTLPASESAQLLAARLQQQGVRYDAVALAELTELCGHLPLALVVAAERAGRYLETSLADLVSDLRHEQLRLDALETADDPASSLRAVFSWSYQALGPDAARLFRMVALHPASEISAAAVAALAGTSTAEVTQPLDRLVEAHLLEERRPGR